MITAILNIERLKRLDCLSDIVDNDSVAGGKVIAGGQEVDMLTLRHIA